MRRSKDLETFMVACRQADQVADLWQLVLDFFHDRGIVKVSFHSNDTQDTLGMPSRIMADGYTDEWICHYIGDGLSQIDPIPQLTARMNRPFLWSETQHLMRLTEAQREYLDALRATGFGDGLAMRVFGPNMRTAYVGLGFGGPAPDLKTVEIFELQCAAQICHLRYCELTSSEPAAVDSLTPRELEVLDWMAHGKSNGVIADILGISRHTVDTLVRRVFEKLDVNDRTTAAIRGLGSGILQRGHKTHGVT